MEPEIGGIGAGAPRREQEAAAGPDLPPEYCRYRDEGCEFAASCLECPYPQCLYEEPGGKRRWLKQRRNREILRLYRGGRWGVGELAARFGVSQRTVQRALKDTPPAKTEEAA